jgi:hypothetical protein
MIRVQHQLIRTVTLRHNYGIILRLASFFLQNLLQLVCLLQCLLTKRSKLLASLRDTSPSEFLLLNQIK